MRMSYCCTFDDPAKVLDRPMVNRPVAAAVLILGWKCCGRISEALHTMMQNKLFVKEPQKNHVKKFDIL